MKIALVIIFFLTPITGFLTHELGHFVAAKSYYKKAQIHYNRTSHEGIANYKLGTVQKRNLIIASSGPIVTFILGVSAGIIFFFSCRRGNISYLEILCLSGIIYLMRFPISIALALFNNELFNTDEYKIAKNLKVDVNFIIIPVVLITCTIALTMFFRLSGKDKTILLLYGLSSSVIGYFMWMKILGPWFLP